MIKYIFPKATTFFLKPIRDHDLLSHVLGGGITTPKGEVFGELMEFILSTPQKHSYNPKLNFKQPQVTMPSKFKFFLQMLKWETHYWLRDELLSEEKLSKQERKDLFNYGETLLTEYIRHWGVNAGEALLGTSRYKGSYIEEERFDLTL